MGLRHLHVQPFQRREVHAVGEVSDGETRLNRPLTLLLLLLLLRLAPLRPLLGLRRGPRLVAQHAQRLAVVHRALAAAVVDGTNVVALPRVPARRRLRQLTQPTAVAPVAHRRPRREHGVAAVVLAPHHADPADQVVAVQAARCADASVPFEARAPQRRRASSLRVEHGALLGAKQIRGGRQRPRTGRDGLRERAHVDHGVEVEVRGAVPERVGSVPRFHALQAQRGTDGDGFFFRSIRRDVFPSQRDGFLSLSGLPPAANVRDEDRAPLRVLGEGLAATASVSSRRRRPRPRVFGRIPGRIDGRTNRAVYVVLDGTPNARVDPRDGVLILSLERLQLVHVRGGGEDGVDATPQPRRVTPGKPGTLIAPD